MLISFTKIVFHRKLLLTAKQCYSSSSTIRFGNRYFIRHLCTPQSSDSLTKVEEENSKKGGFAKAFEKFSAEETLPETKEPTFLSLLKHSKFIDLGDPEEKVITGIIFHVVEDDLYVDFGWKFHCVVPKPAKYGHEYVRGAKVRLIIKDLELSSRFLGSQKDLTLLEADAILLGLVSSPASTNPSKSQ